QVRVALFGNRPAVLFARRTVQRRSQPAVTDRLRDRAKALRLGHLQRPRQRRDLAHSPNALQPLHPLRQSGMLLQPGQQLFLRGLERLQSATAQPQQILLRFRHFFQTVQQCREILRSVELLLVVLCAYFHQQPAHLVLHPHRLGDHQVAVAQQPPQLPQLRRRHVAYRQQMAAHQVGDFPRVQLVVLLFRRADGFHHRRMSHLQLRGKRFQGVVDPAAEQRRFHRPLPGFGAFARPETQDRALGRQCVLLEDGSVGGFHAVADTFLVDVESDIVVYVHWVLLSEVSEPAVMSRSRLHCTLQENPSSSESLYIQPDDRLLSSVKQPCSCEARQTTKNDGLSHNYTSAPAVCGSGVRSCVRNWIACNLAYRPPLASSSSCLPVSTIPPSSITIILSARSMVASRWAITIDVLPSIRRPNASH